MIYKLRVEWLKDYCVSTSMTVPMDQNDFSGKQSLSIPWEHHFKEGEESHLMRSMRDDGAVYYYMPNDRLFFFDLPDGAFRILNEVVERRY